MGVGCDIRRQTTGTANTIDCVNELFTGDPFMTSVPSWWLLLEVGHTSGCTGKLEDVQAGVGPIGDVDVAAVVHLDVVGLDRDFAPLVSARADAAFVGLVGHGRDVIPDLPRIERIADVERADTRVEMR